MKISLDHISKRFQQHWIFKDVNLQFSSPNTYALLGHNGSGKSTLLRIISGMQTASKGNLTYSDGNDIKKEDIHRYISFCAPAMEIVEEYTLSEFLNFHFNFKPLLDGFTIDSIIDTIGLNDAKHKLISDFSSGMKQRVKLAQAIFTDTPVLLLDEPCTNLDETGVKQYQTWIEQHTTNRLVIVASNDEREYGFCNELIKLSDYK